MDAGQGEVVRDGRTRGRPPSVAASPRLGHPGLAPRKLRRAQGRAARDILPLSANATLGPGVRDPVAVLEAQAATRLPELIALRHARMAASPFAFFRGAAAIMALDLQALGDSGIRVQLCGDAHLGNVGLYASPERRLVLDLNDFDETAEGPFEWDVKRMAASFEVAARANGLPDAERSGLTRRFALAYRDAVREASRMSVLATFSGHLEFERVLADLAGRLPAEAVERAHRGVVKARTRTSRQAARALTERLDGAVRFRVDPPILTPLDTLVERGAISEADAHDRLHALLAGYEASLPPNRRRIVAKYRVVDAALKVVGVGSVGTRAWVVLLRGNGRRDVLVLQAKEAQRSVIEPVDGPSAYAHQGRRVVDGQHVMQALSDVLLGWTEGLGADGLPHDFFVRQFRDMKASFTPERMDPVALGLYAETCGLVLARAHARGGDAAVISGYLGDGREFADALADFADAYATRTAADHAALLAAIASGRVAASDLPGPDHRGDTDRAEASR
ncbi:DUF2252 domain-containing protein [Agromyces sp. G08B096]|uniref:DUF2252 domain-containing protein n=1 Tax=Agromyces sp. G08B096 TaxID=3156399 RepID=A0AAU7W983_9MICO